jgi:hypothetical protein
LRERSHRRDPARFQVRRRVKAVEPPTADPAHFLGRRSISWPVVSCVGRAPTSPQACPPLGWTSRDCRGCLTWRDVKETGPDDIWSAALGLLPSGLSQMCPLARCGSCETTDAPQTRFARQQRDEECQSSASSRQAHERLGESDRCCHRRAHPDLQRQVGVGLRSSERRRTLHCLDRQIRCRIDSALEIVRQGERALTDEVVLG